MQSCGCGLQVPMRARPAHIAAGSSQYWPEPPAMPTKPPGALAESSLASSSPKSGAGSAGFSAAQAANIITAAQAANINRAIFRIRDSDALVDGGRGGQQSSCRL